MITWGWVVIRSTHSCSGVGCPNRLTAGHRVFCERRVNRDFDDPGQKRTSLLYWCGACARVRIPFLRQTFR